MVVTALRFWLCHAKSGDVRGEVAVASASFAERFGGGDLTASILVEQLTWQGRPDWYASHRLVEDLRGGFFSLVVTADPQVVVGEWLLMGRSRVSSEGLLQVSGMTWAGYPALRALRQRYRYEQVSQAVIAHDLLSDAFLYANPGMQITIPTPSSPVLRDLDMQWGSGYYADALEQIAAPVDGFEWHVDIAGRWDSDEFLGVSREVVFGWPLLSRPSSLVLEAGEWGTRHGNAVVSESDTVQGWAQTVYATGAGDGAKQLRATATEPLPGQLNMSRRASFPHVTSQAELDALAAAELADAQQLSGPLEVTAWLDGIAELPRVGHEARVVIGRCPAWPEGAEMTGRVGEVAYRSQGHFVETVSMQVA